MRIYQFPYVSGKSDLWSNILTWINATALRLYIASVRIYILGYSKYSAPAEYRTGVVI